MSLFASPRFLRLVMWADAASCAATGALQLALQRPLADLTGLPPLLLTATGLFLLAYASAAAWMARREPLPRTLIGLVALGNLGWALGCAVLVFGSGLALSAWGLAWVAAQQGTRTMRPPIRFALFGLTLFLGGASFLWTGSKLGWLLALMVASLYLWRRPGSTRVKIGAVAVVLVVGLGVFALRFQHYFAHGATSTSARLDYWHAAVQNTGNHPLVGSGPGTFQRPYAQLKAPESEMARLTHNDYLEQFSDSGIPGGLAYTLWIGWALWFCARRVWKSTDAWHFALFAGVLAWFVQGLGEFSLYIPGLAWVTFTLLGCLIGSEINKIDKKNAGL